MGAPQHIAVILDGNRRFARRLMAKPWEGHRFGRDKVRKLLEWCSEFGIKEVTLYAFSVDNFNRPKKEFSFLMRLFREAFEEAKRDREIHEKKVRINFLGRLGMFPSEVEKAMRELSEATRKYGNIVVNFCMAYGGREEISDAARRMAQDAVAGRLKLGRVNDKTLQKYLYLQREPEMIIRTGGEKRLSGFLLYQSSYSELFFVEKMWPEFEKEDLRRCIEEFGKRERRFGR